MFRAFRCVSAALGLVVICSAAASAQPYVYVVVTPGNIENGVTVRLPTRLVTVDAATTRAIRSFDLDLCVTPTSLAVHPNGTRVYVVCRGGSDLPSVLAVDPVAEQLVGTLKLEASPEAIAVTPDGARLLVGIGSPPNAGGVAVIETATLSVQTIIPVAGPVVTGITVSADGQRAYATTAGSVPIVAFIDVPTLAVIDSVPLDLAASDVAVSADGGRLAVVTSPRVTVVDVATASVAGTIDLGTHIEQIAINPAGTRGYAPSLDGVKVLDLDARALITTFVVGSIRRTAATPAADLLFVDTAVGVGVVNVAAQTATYARVVGRLAAFEVAPAAGPTLEPEPCTYSVQFLSPPVPTSAPAGSQGLIEIIALPDRCSWTAQSGVPWITLLAPFGQGSAGNRYTIAPNLTGAPRTGTTTIANQTHTVTQAGCSNPTIAFERPLGGGVRQPYRVSGWAIDRCALPGMGTGLDASFTEYNYGAARSDVAAAFGSQFLNSGFDFGDRERPAGPRNISVSFRSALTGQLAERTVTVNLFPSHRPIGVIDTPAEGAVVSGEMPITGWSVDDFPDWNHVVWVYRHALLGELSSPGAPGRVFLGVATRVPGARPDVAAAFPGYPFNDRAGWGFNVLTNALPNGGNGTFTFEVFTTDWVGNSWLGPRTVTVNNGASPLPFGTVDSPAPGATVSGVIAIHGWALAKSPNTIPSGANIDVYIDNVLVGHPVYGDPRPDVLALFPTYGNAFLSGAHFTFDTTTLTNGLHTLAWVLRDSAGNAKGIGSRFFTVSNP